MNDDRRQGLHPHSWRPDAESWTHQQNWIRPADQTLLLCLSAPLRQTEPSRRSILPQSGKEAEV